MWWTAPRTLRCPTTLQDKNEDGSPKVDGEGNPVFVVDPATGEPVVDPDNPTRTESVATKVIKGTVTYGGTTVPLRGMKAKTPHDYQPEVGVQFNPQSVSRFYREGKLAEDVFSANPAERVDYDLDGKANDAVVPPEGENFDDLYVTADTGTFRIRKPMSSVRGDTARLRKLLDNQDMGIVVAGDVANKGENDFYITQAINTGGAVNSFILDWQVPYWATLEGTVLDAP